MIDNKLVIAFFKNKVIHTKKNTSIEIRYVIKLKLFHISQLSLQVISPKIKNVNEVIKTLFNFLYSFIYRL